MTRAGAKVDSRSEFYNGKFQDGNQVKMEYIAEKIES
jgi:hypothetical protein